jgi:transcriptional regulator with XRE-family HTH domain
MSVQSGSTFGRRLRALRMTLGMSQVELASRIGRHQTAIGPYERDEYEPARDVVEKLALVLETSPEYLYFGRSPQQTALPVLGRFGQAGILEPDLDGIMELVSLRDGQLRGYRVLDDSMAPVFRPGQLALVPAAALGGIDILLGRDALVDLADGRSLLRRLMPSVEPTRFDLVAYNAPPLPSVAVRSARSIVGVLWPEAWRETPNVESTKRNALLVDEKF